MLTGFIKRHPDGFGFFIPDDKDHPDVYVPQNSMKSAMTNDKATIFVEKEKDGRFRGEIIQITERAHTRIAGKFAKINERWGSIKDEGRGWGQDLKIALDKSMNAQDGELVEARILKFPDEGAFEGEIVQVIGDAADPLNDIKRVIITQNIPDKFSNETLEEAKKYSNNPSEKDFAGRKDLRDIPIITIDGATAKDFDDAVYTEMTDTGFHLYVAIADVSHYVDTNTSMDKEAYERGNSVYFPNFVVPMLPEALSNGLCSLNPHVPRLALVAEMNFDFVGEMISSDFYEAVIQSQSRVTYGQAQDIVDGNTNEIANNAKVKENIFRCADLAKVLMAKRFKEGSLDLEVPETELVIDAAGEPIDVIKSERLFAHRLIEELMLAANVAVAKFLAKKEIPAFYRIHESPDSQKISLLQKYMENMGINSTLTGGKLQKRLTRALQEFEGKPEAQIIHILTLRSMSQAKYTHINQGHFGLGFDFYTHFTSPIRRYPDLIVHRLIKNQIMPNSKYRLMAEEDLATAGTWLSATEQKAAKAERQIQAIKKARFMKKMEGEHFEGMISSVTKFGVFVLLRQFNIDGLIRMDDLGQEKLEFDEENLTLTAKRSGLTYKMGQTVDVVVSLVDVEQGQINFVLKDSVGKPKTNLKDSRESRASRFLRNAQNSKHSKGSKNSKGSRPTNKPSISVKPNATNFKTQATPLTSDPKGSYQPKPKYSSLADYLDQKKKGPRDEEKAEQKPAFRSAENRKNSQKRSSPQDDSGGVRKARPKKFSRKNKSR